MNKESIMGKRWYENREPGKFDRQERLLADQTADLEMIEFDYYKN